MRNLKKDAEDEEGEVKDREETTMCKEKYEHDSRNTRAFSDRSSYAYENYSKPQLYDKWYICREDNKN